MLQTRYASTIGAAGCLRSFRGTNMPRIAQARRYPEQVAVNMLNRYGLAVIWELHLSAAEADRKGNAAPARSIILVPDAAEREWLRRTAARSNHN
jgi:hypothetical protein